MRRKALDTTTSRRFDELIAEVERLGWPLRLRITEDAGADRKGRAAGQVLRPRDAAEVYRAAHRGPLLVCSLEQVHVRHDPSVSTGGRANLRTLSRFLEHKACVMLVGDRPAIQRLGHGFADWRSTSDCLNQNDPRALPLHVFDAGRPWPELTEVPGRIAFAKEFGPPARRTDGARRRWEKASVAHGRDLVKVAGRDFGRGAHWDVQFAKAGRLLSANEVWEVPRRSYLNVYPDGGIRAGSTDVPSAKRVWP